MLRELMTMRVLKHAVSTKILCQCGSILDCTRSILADVEYDESTTTMFVCCAACWDSKSKDRILDGYGNAKNRIAMGLIPNKDPDLLTLTITDGRDLDWTMESQAQRYGL